jgi:putative endonuclease
MYLVYILQSLKDRKYYIGQTENLDRRIEDHNKKRVRSTRKRTPLILIRKEIFNTRGEARKRENYLKKLKGGNEFKKIISKTGV